MDFGVGSNLFFFNSKPIRLKLLFFCHTWNDKSAADLFLSSRTTGLTGMAGLLAAEVADVLTGLTEAEFTGVCHGLALDLSLLPLPVEVWGENMGCLA